MGWGGSGCRCASDSQLKQERDSLTVGKCSQVTSWAAGNEKAAALLSCLLLEHRAVMLLLWPSYKDKAKPGTCCPGSLPTPFPLLFQFPLQFSQDPDESAEADKSLGGFTPTKPNHANSGRQHRTIDTLASEMQTRYRQKA